MMDKNRCCLFFMKFVIGIEIDINYNVLYIEVGSKKRNIFV